MPNKRRFGALSTLPPLRQSLLNFSLLMNQVTRKDDSAQEECPQRVPSRRKVTLASVARCCSMLLRELHHVARDIW